MTGRGDLHRFRDGTIHQQNLRLRERYENIEAAGTCVQAILKSQWPGKPAPHLYNLFHYFLKKIPEVERPLDLATIFLTKTLKHEGLLQQTESCAFCDKKPTHRFGGERVCSIHAGTSALQLIEQEERLFMRIAEGRSLTELLEHPIKINSQIAQLFEQAF
ncbi:MAG: DNA repair protein RecO [Chlamydiales bacterium]|nr:DNA repair protein RecO [Chlamydiales bacterium]